MSFVRKLVKAVLPPSATIRLRAAFKHHEMKCALLSALCVSTRHQAIANWGKIGGYINNFVFIPAENYAATREGLSRLGYPAPA